MVGRVLVFRMKQRVIGCARNEQLIFLQVLCLPTDRKNHATFDDMMGDEEMLIYE